MINQISREEVRSAIEDKLCAQFSISSEEATNEQIFQATAIVIRELMSRLLAVEDPRKGEKEVHYMSMEFLMGRSLMKNAYNLGVADAVVGALEDMGRSAADIFHHPEHPYSRMLLSAVPSADPLKRGREMITPRGEVPSAIDLPAGCRFHDRCPYAKDICRKQEPLLNAAERAEHRCACWKVLAEQEGRNWDWEVH